MGMSIEDLEREIATLPVDDRVQLAERIMARDTDPAVAEAWYDEAERRADEVRRGAGPPLADSGEVMARLDSIVGKEG